jgi:aminopeptidase N
MISIRFYLILFAILYMAACSSLKQNSFSDYDESWDLDTLVVTAPRVISGSSQDKYWGTEARSFDMKHMDLQLSFDWQSKEVSGIATLWLAPYFYPQEVLVLDAKEMSFQKILFGGKEINYSYDGSQLLIPLGRTITRNEEIEIEIQYITQQWSNRSTAPPFNEELGLYFVPGNDSLFTENQLWTQGETEYNSFWFPCIDHPNEQITHEISVRIDSAYTSLSNGKLLKQIYHEDGTRTDLWSMDLPHAVYLVDLVVGVFAEHSETVNGLYYQYLVDPAFKHNAQQIFDHTPEMLGFFSTITGVPFPWQKYAQVVVRDYTAGAMENTTATIFGSFVQRSSLELNDYSNEGIVAHELFHHWFGNYVTCENWANLGLNEGFASYGEYLWFEHKHGFEKAEELRYSQLMNYLYNASFDPHPFVDHYYEHREEMFDAHSYDKGSLILHMLRNLLGDEAFFEGIRVYLLENAFSPVEADHLRFAFEKVSGLDLKPFFRQWFERSGHPELELNYQISSDSLIIDVIQRQSIDQRASRFEVPLTIALFDSSGTKTNHHINISKEEERFVLKVQEPPVLVLFDPGKELLGTLKVLNDTTDHASSVLQLAKHPIHRYQAANQLGEVLSENQALKSLAVTDPYYRVRQYSINWLSPDNAEDFELLMNFTLRDEHFIVRHNALQKLSDFSDVTWLSELCDSLKGESSYTVLGLGLSILAEKNDSLAVALASARLHSDSPQLLLQMFKILRSSERSWWLSPMEESMERVPPSFLEPILQEYVLFAGEQGNKGRIQARTWINTQIKQCKKKDHFYRMLIKYRQMLL